MMGLNERFHCFNYNNYLLKGQGNQNDAHVQFNDIKYDGTK